MTRQPYVPLIQQNIYFMLFADAVSITAQPWKRDVYEVLTLVWVEEVGLGGDHHAAALIFKKTKSAASTLRNLLDCFTCFCCFDCQVQVRRSLLEMFESPARIFRLGCASFVFVLGGGGGGGGGTAWIVELQACHRKNGIIFRTSCDASKPEGADLST